MKPISLSFIPTKKEFVSIKGLRPCWCLSFRWWLCARPAQMVHGPTHGGRTHLHAVFSFPPAAIVLHPRARMSFQQFLQSYLNRYPFLRGPPWNGSWRDGSCLASLFHVALNGGL